MKNKIESCGGCKDHRSQPGLLMILATIFIVLKLVGTITWSWWIVLIPLWLPAFMAMCLLFVYLTGKIILMFIEG